MGHFHPGVHRLLPVPAVHGLHVCSVPRAHTGPHGHMLPILASGRSATLIAELQREGEPTPVMTQIGRLKPCWQLYIRRGDS